MIKWDEDGQVWSMIRLPGGSFQLTHYEEEGDLLVVHSTEISRHKWLEIVGHMAPQGRTTRVRFLLKEAFRDLNDDVVGRRVFPGPRLDEDDTDKF